MYIQLAERSDYGIVKMSLKYHILDDQGNVIKTTTGKTVINQLKKDLDMKQPLRYQNVSCVEGYSNFAYNNDVERIIKVKSGEWVYDSISVQVSLDGKKAEITDDSGGLELTAETCADGDNTWIGVNSKKYGYFIPVLVQKLGESAIPPWDYDNHHAEQRMAYSDLGGICQVKVTLLSAAYENYWGKNGGVELRFCFKRTPELTTCSVFLISSRGERWMGLAGGWRYELQFTDSNMRFDGRTYRLFTPADLPKAQLLGSYEKVFS